LDDRDQTESVITIDRNSQRANEDETPTPGSLHSMALKDSFIHASAAAADVHPRTSSASLPQPTVPPTPVASAPFSAGKVFTPRN
jgi:hypothetical protein